jgi:predicted RNA-binding Zn-ribbon protein involved in translation (DUF1610 family)
MANPTLCANCGTILRDEKPGAELVLTSPKTGEVSAAQRMVYGFCPVCGPQMVQRAHMGNHSTYAEAEMKRRYPKNLRLRLKEKLTHEDRRRFNAALHGFLLATDEDRARWDAVCICFQTLVKMMEPSNYQLKIYH